MVTDDMVIKRTGLGRHRELSNADVVIFCFGVCGLIAIDITALRLILKLTIILINIPSWKWNWICPMSILNKQWCIANNGYMCNYVDIILPLNCCGIAIAMYIRGGRIIIHIYDASSLNPDVYLNYQVMPYNYPVESIHYIK